MRPGPETEHRPLGGAMVKAMVCEEFPDCSFCHPRASLKYHAYRQGAQSTKPDVRALAAKARFAPQSIQSQINRKTSALPSYRQKQAIHRACPKQRANPCGPIGPTSVGDNRLTHAACRKCIEPVFTAQAPPHPAPALRSRPSRPLEPNPWARPSCRRHRRRWAGSDSFPRWPG